MKTTPFYFSEVKYGATMTTEGWLVPTKFKGNEIEHTAIRERVGVCDFSGMGEIDVKGKDARRFLDEHCVNDVANLKPGRIVYTSFLDEEGVMIDDTTIYCHNEEHFWIITSAPRRNELVAWLEERSHNYGDAKTTDISSAIGLLAVQGPKSREMLSTIVEDSLDKISYYGFMWSKVSGIPALVSRTGFTGELGYELLVNSEDANHLWEVLAKAGEPYGLEFCGTITTVGSIPVEKGYITIKEYGNKKTPLEVGLGWSIKWNKPFFVGKEKLLEKKEQGFASKLIGYILEDTEVRVPLGSEVYVDGKKVGNVSSAAYGLTLKKNLGQCFVETPLAKVGQAVSIRIDGKDYAATLANKGFYDPKGEKLRS